MPTAQTQRRRATSDREVRGASLSQRIQTLRRQKGLTQAELAGSDFTKGFISHLERGRSRLSVRAAGILAQRLGVGITALLGDAGGADLEVKFRVVAAERELALGRPKAALELLQRAGQVADGPQQARVLRLQGIAMTRLGRRREALSALSVAVRTFRRYEDAELRIRTTYDLAYAHASLDQPGEALMHLLESARALEAGEFVDRTLEMQVHSLLAGTYMRLGDGSSAEVAADRAATLANEVFDSAALDTLYATLMAVRREQGDLEGALLYARKALALHERAGEESRAVYAWDNLAWIYTEREQFARAEEAIRKAERILESRGLTSSGHLRVTQARLELARHRPKQALELCQEVLADPNTDSATRAQALFARARAVAGLGRAIGEVRSAFESAIETYADQPRAKQAKVHEAFADELARRGLHKDAYGQARRAMELARATPIGPRSR